MEDYPPTEHPEEQETIAQIVEESGDGITRKRLLEARAAGAGGALGARGCSRRRSRSGPRSDIERALRDAVARGARGSSTRTARR